MPRLSLYLDDETAQKARRAARLAGLSLSGWARVNLRQAADDGTRWPEGYFDLFGSISDPTFMVAEDAPATDDLPRASW